MFSPTESGIDQDALKHYMDEQIYSLPGIENHRDVFTVLLTGSRATGKHSVTSDIDIDVLCPQNVYDVVQMEAYRAGFIKSQTSFFCIQPAEKTGHYFGIELGNPHFSVTPLEKVQKQFSDYEDVPLWIWTNAKIITDPSRQFKNICNSFTAYPHDILINKIKYHWLMGWYWAIEVYPLHHKSDDELLPAASSLLNAINEFLRVFFLVDGKPFPYTERLVCHAADTTLGHKSLAYLRDIVDLVVGKTLPDMHPWQRLDSAFESLCCSDKNHDAKLHQEMWDHMLVETGLDEEWVDSAFDNIDDLINGSLGPPP
ncbi:DUF4037 domain-containing protein [bacterium]|nr:DUF4037 domain-containing protein [bacterium]